MPDNGEPGKRDDGAYVERCERCAVALTMVPVGGCGFDNCPSVRPRLPDNGEPDDRDNHALLIGEIAGILSTRLTVDLEVADGNYTGRIFIYRPSGRWIVTAERDAR